MDNFALVFLEDARKRLVSGYPAQVRAALLSLTDEQLWWRANSTSNSVGNLVLHVCGSTRHFLGRGVGECHLRRPEIADMIAEALRPFHEEQYMLDDWVVMPNHVHLILWPMPNFTLSKILKSRKRHTARRANLMLGKTGETFWQRESYDHCIRNDEEKSRIRGYIRMNQVNARLCKLPEDWKWSSAWPGWNAAAQPTQA